MSYLQGVTRNDNLLRAAYRVLFTRRYSLRQPSRNSRPCLVYKALFTTTTFPEQSIVSCLQGVIHYDSFPGAIDRVLFTRRYSSQPSRSSLTSLVYQALFTKTAFLEQPIVSCLQDVFATKPRNSLSVSCLLGVIRHHKPQNSLTVSCLQGVIR